MAELATLVKTHQTFDCNYAGSVPSLSYPCFIFLQRSGLGTRNTEGEVCATSHGRLGLGTGLPFVPIH